MGLTQELVHANRNNPRWIRWSTCNAESQSHQNLMFQMSSQKNPKKNPQNTKNMWKRESYNFYLTVLIIVLITEVWRSSWFRYIGQRCRGFPELIWILYKNIYANFGHTFRNYIKSISNAKSSVVDMNKWMQFSIKSLLLTFTIR